MPSPPSGVELLLILESLTARIAYELAVAAVAEVDATGVVCAAVVVGSVAVDASAAVAAVEAEAAVAEVDAAGIVHELIVVAAGVVREPGRCC